MLAAVPSLSFSWTSVLGADPGRGGKGDMRVGVVDDNAPPEPNNSDGLKPRLANLSAIGDGDGPRLTWLALEGERQSKGFTGGEDGVARKAAKRCTTVFAEVVSRKAL
mmetsp:Transcript_58166/g.152195  ORF Transcript_58166/g.152195 Transcript_58166/m.152195 type:complete len:108 (-) Transcript_58166:1530-1853(-)